jgi:hypothetical protein
MAEQVVKTMELLPDYQEEFLKNLLANIFQTDEDGNIIGGLATESPLYGKPVYQMEGGGTTLDPTMAALDLDGNKIQFYETPEGEFTTDASLAATDQYGEPIFAVEGGVAPPEAIGFTDAQVDAIRRLTGYKDPVTGEVIYEGLMGAYEPYLDESLDMFRKSADLAESSTGRYDPLGEIVYDTVTETDPVTGETIEKQVARTVTDPETGEVSYVREGGYEAFYNPFVEDVVDTTLADIKRQGEIERSRLGSQLVSSGAFGGSRQAIAEQELARNVGEQVAKTGSELRSAAFTGALDASMNAFENQQKRGIDAATMFSQLGTGIGALGEAAQQLGFQDVNALFNTGRLEQEQLQKEYDAQRAAQLEEAYEPFARFAYMRDILSGVPVSGTGISAVGIPESSSFNNVLTGANVYSSSQGDGNIFGKLGGLKT